MRNFILMIIAAAAYVAGGVFMKLSNGLTKLLPSIFLFMFFCAGAAVQTFAMRNAPMGPSYVFVLGFEAILAFVVGLWMFSEPATLSRVTAVALIGAGIVLLKST